MRPDLDEQIARTLDADERLLSLLPEFLADLRELGTFADDIVSTLAAAGFDRSGSRVRQGRGGRGSGGLSRPNTPARNRWIS